MDGNNLDVSLDSLQARIQALKQGCDQSDNFKQILDKLEDCLELISSATIPYNNKCEQYIPVIIEIPATLKIAIVRCLQLGTSDEQKRHLVAKDESRSRLDSLLEDICFNTELHAAILRTDTTPDRSVHNSFLASTRDFFKEAYIPLLFTVDLHLVQNNTTDPKVPLSTAQRLSNFFKLANTAANHIGWRFPHAETAHYLRSYALLNILWGGLVKAVTTLTNEQLMRMPPTSNSAPSIDIPTPKRVISRLIELLIIDYDTMYDRGHKSDASDVKLLLFWVMHMSKIQSAHPKQVSEQLWEGLQQWVSSARARCLAADPSLTTVHTNTNKTTAASFTTELAGSTPLWSRVAKLQIQSLAFMDVMDMQRRITSLIPIITTEASQFLSAIQILEQSVSTTTTTPCVRIALFPMFKECMNALLAPACCCALETAAQREKVADAVCAYSMSLSTLPFGDVCPRQEDNTWELCQLQMMEISMRPHPFVLAIMSRVWSIFGHMADTTTVKHHVSALHALLSSTAAQDAARMDINSTQFFSPVSTQLIHLLASLLGSIPETIAENFCARFISLPTLDDARDCCKLAPLAALATVASLTKRSSICLLPAMGVIDSLCQQMGVTVGNGGGDYEVDVVMHHRAWTYQCLSACLGCLFETTTGEPSRNIAALVATVTSRVVTALAAMNDMGSEAPTPPPPPPVAVASAAAKVLRVAYTLHPASIASSRQNMDVISNFMGTCLEFAPTMLASDVAALIPALSHHVTPPKPLFEFVLNPNKAQSVCVQIVGRESYVKYAKECSVQHVLEALPSHWLDTSGSRLDSAMQSIVQNYLDPSNASLITPYNVYNDHYNASTVYMALHQDAQRELSACTAHNAAAKGVTVRITAEEAENKSNNIEMRESLLNIAALEAAKSIDKLKTVWQLAEFSDSEQAAMVAVIKEAREALSRMLQEASK